MKTASELYAMPLFELLQLAMQSRRQNWDSRTVRLCGLLSIKTGACTEDCSYCAQSARYQTGITPHTLLDLDAVFEAAVDAKARGVSHFCLSAAWREFKDGDRSERVLQMFESIRGLGLRLCANLGMVDASMVQKLQSVGVEFYNHNLDTSPEFYSEIVSAHSYTDRLETLDALAKVGVQACVGMIMGLGESHQDRISFVEELQKLKVPPSSIPVNVLVPIPGTPLAQNPRPGIWEIVRMIAVLRVLFPQSWIPLAAGRREMSQVEQTLCLLAGANSLFAGEKLLTTNLPGQDELQELLGILGLIPLENNESQNDKKIVKLEFSKARNA